MGQTGKRIVLGQLGAPNGLKGWLTAQLSMHSPQDLLQYKTCFTERLGKHESINIEDMRAVPNANGNKWLLKLRGVDNRESAEAYRLKKLMILRENLPELEAEEYYWSDLEGLNVVQDNKELGTVVGLFENAGLDVMTVKQGAKQYFIPFVMGDTIQEVDLVNKKIVINWPEDLL